MHSSKDSKNKREYLPAQQIKNQATCLSLLSLSIIEARALKNRLGVETIADIIMLCRQYQVIPTKGKPLLQI